MISVITCTKREHLLGHALANFERQTAVDKEWIVILNSNGMQFRDAPDWVRIFRLDESATLGECLNFGCAKARGGIIAKMDDDDYYGPEYLADSLKVMRSSGAGVAGKAGIFVYFKQERLLSLFRPHLAGTFLKKEMLAGGTLVFQKEVLDNVSFRSLNVGEDVQFQRDCLAAGIPLYSGGIHDYALVRYGEERHGHSWAAGDQDFQKSCRPLLVTDEFERIVRGEE